MLAGPRLPQNRRQVVASILGGEMRTPLAIVVAVLVMGCDALSPCDKEEVVYSIPCGPGGCQFDLLRRYTDHGYTCEHYPEANEFIYEGRVLHRRGYICTKCR